MQTRHLAYGHTSGEILSVRPKVRALAGAWNTSVDAKNTFGSKVR